VVKDTPRQDILPRLEGGLLSRRESAARGALFPQPWLQQGETKRRMDEVAGHGWRLVLASDAAASADADLWRGLARVSLQTLAETEGVAADWFRRHACVAALVRPDNYVYGVAATAEEAAALIEEAALALGVKTACEA
jgi:3-(3-hydroxy-phenyl)propionate hydroxylase